MNFHEMLQGVGVNDRFSIGYFHIYFRTILQTKYKDGVLVEWSLGTNKRKEEVTYLRRKKKKSGIFV